MSHSEIVPNLQCCFLDISFPIAPMISNTHLSVKCVSVYRHQKSEGLSHDSFHYLLPTYYMTVILSHKMELLKNEINTHFIKGKLCWCLQNIITRTKPISICMVFLNSLDNLSVKTQKFLNRTQSKHMLIKSYSTESPKFQ